MKTPAQGNEAVLDDRKGMNEPFEFARYPVDASVPDFTKLLMNCFIEAQKTAISENEALIAVTNTENNNG